MFGRKIWALLAVPTIVLALNIVASSAQATPTIPSTAPLTLEFTTGSTPLTVYVPLENFVGVVEWGDGTIESSAFGAVPGHGYSNAIAAGTVLTAKFYGTASRLGDYGWAEFGGATHLTAVRDWGDLGPSFISLEAAFLGCTSLSHVPPTLPISVTSLKAAFAETGSDIPAEIESWDTRRVTDMSYMFANASRFNRNIALWDTSQVRSMLNMFDGASAFNQNVGYWNTSSVTDMANMFNGATRFNVDLYLWDTSNVTDMSYMFAYAASFNQPLEEWSVVGPRQYTSWETSNVTDMSGMFMGARAFNNFINVDTSAVTNMSSMFEDASSFNRPLNGWDTSAVVDMSLMFRGATAFNQSIGAFDTSSVTTMSGMFSEATTFNQDLHTWDTSRVTDMGTMFGRATHFNGDISTWDTHLVQDMSYMFNHAISFNHPINKTASANVWGSTWDTSSVTNMEAMFWRAEAFNQPIGNWDTHAVVTFIGMFEGALAFNQDIGQWVTSGSTSMAWMFKNTPFNQDISHWDTGAVEYMTGMFYGAGSFSQNLGGWDISSLSWADMMLDGSGMSTLNYSYLLHGWAASPHRNNVTLGMGPQFFSSVLVDRLLLINTWRWVITDSGETASLTPAVVYAPTASDILVGQALTSSALAGGSATAPGSFQFTSPHSTPASGTQTVSVTFVPENPIKYTTFTLDVTVQVNNVPSAAPNVAQAVAADVAGDLSRTGSNTIAHLLLGLVMLLIGLSIAFCTTALRRRG